MSAVIWWCQWHTQRQIQRQIHKQIQIQSAYIRYTKSDRIIIHIYYYIVYSICICILFVFVFVYYLYLYLYIICICTFRFKSGREHERLRWAQGALFPPLESFPSCRCWQVEIEIRQNTNTLNVWWEILQNTNTKGADRWGRKFVNSSNTNTERLKWVFEEEKFRDGKVDQGEFVTLINVLTETPKKYVRLLVTIKSQRVGRCHRCQ